MGMFDDVSLSPRVRTEVERCYPGVKEIRFDGWQSKSMECSLAKVLLGDDLTVDGRKAERFTGAITFYKNSGHHADPATEWLEFTALYLDGKFIAVRYVPNSD